jgi:CheY-like chemotaxis protein
MAAAMLPDVMLLDIGLPGLTGYEVAEHIRRDERLKHIVLVALTGYGRSADRQLSQSVGFDYHLVKPADFREVEKILAIVSAQLALPGQAGAPGR